MHDGRRRTSSPHTASPRKDRPALRLVAGRAGDPAAAGRTAPVAPGGGVRFGGQAATPLGAELRATAWRQLLPALRAVLSAGARQPCPALVVDRSPRVLELVCSRDGPLLACARPVDAAPAGSPRRVPLWVDFDPWHDRVEELVERTRRGVVRHVAREGEAPRVILLAALGMVTTGVDEPAARRVRDAYRRTVDAMAGATTPSRFAPLPP